jgi:hypothetical protein
MLHFGGSEHGAVVLPVTVGLSPLIFSNTPKKISVVPKPCHCETGFGPTATVGTLLLILS